MAQGFVANLNLIESNTTPSDRAILDNLGGINISTDLLLFDGNSRFKSILRNNQEELVDTEVFFGQFVPGTKYKIIEVGASHDWTLVGATTGSQGEVFVADANGDGDTGVGGYAKEVYTRVDFENFFDTTNNNGWSVRVIGANKVAFSTGSLIAIGTTAPNSITDYPYKIHNSNGENVFQIISSIPPDPPSDPVVVLNLADIIAGMAGVDIDNVMFTRSDTITSQNIANMKVPKIPTDDEAEGGGSISLGEDGGDSTDDDEEISPLEQVAYIGNIIGRVKYKKSRTVVNFLDNSFDIRFRMNGLMQIDNTDSIEIGFDRGVNALLVQGQEYEIISTGDTTDSYFNSVSGLSTTWNNNDKFIAITVGSASGNGSARIKATTPPGLFIMNAGNKIRAFSGTENPWATIETGNTPSFITGGALRSEPATQTVKVKDLVLKNFSAPSSTDVDLIKTNSGKTALEDQINSQNIAIDNYSHKLPIVVNGEQFYILTKQI
jgi:hypothetical protein